MNLLADVLGRLDELGSPVALIGAEALALRGASRSTFDRDLLTTDPRALEPSVWAPLVAAGARVEVRRGDSEDPLAGVVRFEAEGERPIDLVVGRDEWQTRLLERCESMDLGEVRIAVPRSADLILLKLYAGGPQDAWDVTELVAGEDRAALIAEVENGLPDLPPDSRRLWRKILEG